MVGRHVSPRLTIALPPRATEKFNLYKAIVTDGLPSSITPENVQIIEAALTIAIEQAQKDSAHLRNLAIQTKRASASANTLSRSEYRISPKVLNQEPRQTAGGGARSHEMDPAGFTPGFHPEPAPNGQEIGLLARSLAGLPWEGAGWAL